MTNSTPTQSQENPMDPNVTIVEMFNSFLAAGGSPKVTSFKKHLDQLINANVKQLCSGRGKSATQAGSGGSDWRTEQKNMFSGRGAKWVKISLDSIESTLCKFEEDGIDCSNYRMWTKEAGYSWIRYAGPRVSGNVAMAAFEVRTGGSKIDHPKQLHFIANDELDIERLDATPHAKGLEVIASPSVATEADSDDSPSEEVVVDEVQSDVPVSDASDVSDEVEVSHPAAPTSDDPEEWEAFLTAEGLGVDSIEDEDNIFESFEG